MTMLEKQAMQYRNLGNSGLRISRIGLGPGLSLFRTMTQGAICNTSPQTPNAEDVVEQILTVAYESGVNYFDTSDGLHVGRAETEKGLSRKHIVETLQNTLERMGLTYVDVVFACGRDSATPIEEIVRAFSWVIDKGWAFYWGTACWSQAEVMEAYTVAKVLSLVPPLADQSEYNLFRREPVELVIPELLCSIGCGSIACSPLAGGLISGEYEGMDFLQSSNDPGGVPLQTAARLALLEHQQQLCTGIEPDKPRDRTYSDVSSQIHKLKFLRPLTEQLGCSMAQLSIAWCLRSDLVQSVLISPVTLEQLREQLLALSVIDKLTPEVLAVMEKILGNQPSLGMTKSKNSAKKDPNSRRRSSVHRKSISSSPRLSISHANNPHEGRLGYRDSVDYSYDRRPSHI